MAHHQMKIMKEIVVLRTVRTRDLKDNRSVNMPLAKSKFSFRIVKLLLSPFLKAIKALGEALSLPGHGWLNY